MRMIDADCLLDALNSIILDYTSEGKYPDGFGIDDAINLVEGAPTLTPPNEWISVEDRLPPNMDDVLVVVRDNGECWTATGYYSSMSKVWYAVLNGQDTQMDVLWWMPFPASPDSRPPEGEE